MTGRELYYANRQFYAEDWGVDMPEWEELTPMRRWSWEVAAMEYNLKRLDDEDHARMEDEGGPYLPESDDNGD